MNKKIKKFIKENLKRKVGIRKVLDTNKIQIRKNKYRNNRIGKLGAEKRNND